jgi:hypothetical protein
MNNTDAKVHKQHVDVYKQQLRQFLLTSRFNNETFQENTNFRNKNPKIGCVYCAPDPITQKIPMDTVLFILEMNNDTNRVVGIGMVRNHPVSNNSYKTVYNNRNYNRYVYVGKYRIDRSEMNEYEERIMKFFDILCFTGNRHMKRGQGLKSFPVDILYRCNKTMDLVNFISEMFKKKITANKNDK